MDQNAEQIISGLRSKIAKLISMHEGEKDESRKLLQANNDLNRQLQEDKTQIDEFKNKYNTLKMAKTVEAGSGDTVEAKNKINKIVREIDNCIALLNR